MSGTSARRATLVVAGITAGAAAAGVTQNDVNQTQPFDVFVPCANGGAGEDVSGTVDLHTLVTFTINDNNVSGKFHFQPQGSNLVGSVTGDVYQAHEPASPGTLVTEPDDTAQGGAGSAALTRASNRSGG